jgi:Domain of unknown function (DUF6916)
MLENLHLNSFSEHLNTKFRAHAGDKIVELELAEATDLGSNAKQEQFSLVFRGPLDTALDQMIYKIEHDALGSFDLLVVPIGKDEGGRDYEVIFNRLLR